MKLLKCIYFGAPLRRAGVDRKEKMVIPSCFEVNSISKWRIDSSVFGTNLKVGTGGGT